MFDSNGRISKIGWYVKCRSCWKIQKSVLVILIWDSRGVGKLWKLTWFSDWFRRENQIKRLFIRCWGGVQQWIRYGWISKKLRRFIITLEKTKYKLHWQQR